MLKFNSQNTKTVTHASPKVDDDDAPDDDDYDPEDSRFAQPRMRPATTKFMATVATKYLRYTVEQRKSTPLALEGKESGTFNNLCIPISGFHPYYQKKRVYCGEVSVSELTNVYFLRFRNKMHPDGKKEERTYTAEIKLTKKWLKEHERDLADLLSALASKKNAKAWCFFYSETPVETQEKRAQFMIEAPHLIAVIDTDALVMRAPLDG